MHCPRCQSVGLHTGKSDAMTVHACGRCGGVWLAPDNAARLLQWVTVQPWQEPVQVACAVCQQTMHGKYVVEANVVVDECTGHGFWFDRHEMEHVAGAVARKRGRPEPKFPGYAVAGAALAGVAAASAVTAAVMAGSEELPPESEHGYAADVAVEAAIWSPEIVEGGSHIGSAVVDAASGVIGGSDAGGTADAAGGVADAVGGVAGAAAGAADAGGDAAEVAVVGVAAVHIAGDAGGAAADVAGGAAGVAGDAGGDVAGAAVEIAGGAPDVASGAADLAGGAADLAGGVAEGGAAAVGGAAEVAGGAAEAAAEVAGGAAEAAGGIVEAIAEILGGLAG